MKHTQHRNLTDVSLFIVLITKERFVIGVAADTKVYQPRLIWVKRRLFVNGYWAIPDKTALNWVTSPWCPALWGFYWGELAASRTNYMRQGEVEIHPFISTGRC